MKFVCLLVALVALAPRPAAGQNAADPCTGTPPNVVCTGPLTASHRLEFTMPPDILTVAAAQAHEPRLRIVTTSPNPYVLTETCTGTAPPFLCTAPIPTAALAVLNGTGSHVVTIALFDLVTMLEGEGSVPFVLRSRPGAVTGARIRLGP